MHLIVDGYNVIFADEELAALMARGRLEDARNQLCARLRLYQAVFKENITVVFDGVHNVWSPVSMQGSMRILFSRSPQKADNLILGIVHTERKPGRLKVVSSDREICEEAQGRSVKTVSAEAFLHQLAKARRQVESKHGLTSAEPGEKYGKTPSSAEIQGWLSIFRDIDADS